MRLCIRLVLGMTLLSGCYKHDINRDSVSITHSYYRFSVKQEVNAEVAANTLYSNKWSKDSFSAIRKSDKLPDVENLIGESYISKSDIIFDTKYRNSLYLNAHIFSEPIVAAKNYHLVAVLFTGRNECLLVSCIVDKFTDNDCLHLLLSNNTLQHLRHMSEKK